MVACDATMPGIVFDPASEVIDVCRTPGSGPRRSVGPSWSGDRNCLGPSENAAEDLGWWPTGTGRILTPMADTFEV
jgi:hypothetical protein